MLLIRDVIKHWHQYDHAQRLNAMHTFMSALKELYTSPEDIQKLVALDKAAIFAIGTLYMKWGLEKIETLASEAYADPWELACNVRTNLELYNVIFGNSCGKLDLKPFENWMEEQKASTLPVNPKNIPHNIPEGHWWWGFEGIS